VGALASAAVVDDFDTQFIKSLNALDRQRANKILDKISRAKNVVDLGVRVHKLWKSLKLPLLGAGGAAVFETLSPLMASRVAARFKNATEA